MSTGLSGSNPTINGDPAVSLALVELRVISNLLQQSGINQGEDLNTWRNDIANSLGLPDPSPNSL